ncbi:MAG TPA: hypothetical protein G4O15_06250 [Dehalococcoidia bacterium]|nr:hypothetical protein [Dehalococcoidia bacterium]
MKKRILLIALVVCLVFGGIGGVVYASYEHEPVAGDKLVGCVTMGTIPNDTRHLGDYRLYPYFNITNPNCDSSITDIHVSVLRTDRDNGFVESVYEGPLKVGFAPEGLECLAPHQSVSTHLPGYFDNGGELLAGPTYAYTIEISYGTAEGAAPLIGWQILWTLTTREGGTEYDDQGKQSPMINITAGKKAKK